MSAEIAEAIRQTRRTLTEKTWVPYFPGWAMAEVCLAIAIGESPAHSIQSTVSAVFLDMLGLSDVDGLILWNDRQTDVGAVLGMTLQALIAELCKGDA